jgi:hypothetical protein
MPIRTYIDRLRIDIVNTINLSDSKVKIRNNIVALKSIIDEKVPPAYCPFVHFLYKCHNSCFGGDTPIINRPIELIIKNFAFFFDLVKVIFRNSFFHINNYISDFQAFFSEHITLTQYLNYRRGTYLTKNITLESAFLRFLESDNATIQPTANKLTTVADLVLIRDRFKNYSEFRDYGMDKLIFYFGANDNGFLHTPEYKIEFIKYAKSIFHKYIIDYLMVKNETIFSAYPQFVQLIIPIFVIPYKPVSFSQLFLDILLDPNKKSPNPALKCDLTPNEQMYIDEFDFI